MNRNDRSPTAAALVQLAATRDPAAWSVLVEQHGPAIYRTSVRILGDPAAAEDACQETFLSIRACAGQFTARGDQPELAARGWIMRVAVNCALQIARRRKTVNHPLPDAIAAAPAPELRDLSIIKREIEALPDKQKQVLCLHFYAGLDYPEVARALNCSVNNARVRMHRGLETLRKRLAGCGLALSLGVLTDRLRAAEVPTPPTELTSHWQDLCHASAQPTVPASGGFSLMAKLAISGATLAAAVLLAMTAIPGRSADSVAHIEAKSVLSNLTLALKPDQMSDLEITLDAQEASFAEILRLFNNELRIPMRLEGVSPETVWGSLNVADMRVGSIQNWLCKLPGLHGYREADGTFVISREERLSTEAPRTFSDPMDGAPQLHEYPKTELAVDNVSPDEFMRKFYGLFGGKWQVTHPVAVDDADRISVCIMLNKDGPYRKEKFKDIMTNGKTSVGRLPHYRLLKKPVRVDFENSSLTDVFAAIERATGIPVRMGPADYIAPRITLHAGVMEAEGVLHTIADALEMLYCVGGDGAAVFYYRKFKPPEKSFRAGDCLTIPAPVGRRLISVDFRDQTIAEVAELFRNELRIPLRIEGPVDMNQKITLGMQNRELDDVLYALREVRQSYAKTEYDGTLVVDR